MTDRKIIHIDMDCFYAAVECRDRPEFIGKPVAVGGSPEGRGVVATANYEARRFGVRSAMASATAVRLCPQLIMLRPNFAKYKRESKRVRAILESFSTQIEPLSLDEAYLDVSTSTDFSGSATLIAKEIRRRVREELDLAASAGVGPNKFLAKIACELAKPDGLRVIHPREIEAFMKTLPIEKIWGVGKVTAAKMKQKGIATCGDLQNFSVAELSAMFGSWGPSLFDFARGIDGREVREDRERKSLTVEETYFQDLKSLGQVLEQLPELYDDWNERAVRAGIAGRIRGLYVKLKFHDFQTTTHESVFTSYPVPNDFKPLLKAAFERRAEPVRLIGIGVRLATEAKKNAPRGSGAQLDFDF